MEKVTEIKDAEGNFVRRKVQFMCEGPSRTEQSHKKKVNINTIVKKIQKGVMPPLRSGGVYGDFTGVPEYQDSLNRVNDAMNDFMALPSDIRKRFDNDPAKLIEFISKEENRQEAERIGLIPKSETVPPEEPPTEPPAEG